MQTDIMMCDLTKITGEWGLCLYTDMDLCDLVAMNFISPTTFKSQQDAWRGSCGKMV